MYKFDNPFIKHGVSILSRYDAPAERWPVFNLLITADGRYYKATHYRHFQNNLGVSTASLNIVEPIIYQFHLLVANNYWFRFSIHGMLDQQQRTYWEYGNKEMFDQHRGPFILCTDDVFR